MVRVGTDIVKISRIKESYNRFGEKFLNRYLNSEEFNSKTSIESLAGFWASKEAIAKALGCGIGSELSFLDITIKKDKKGAPYFVLSKEALLRFNIKDSSLSISHDGGFAIAVVIILI